VQTHWEPGKNEKKKKILFPTKFEMKTKQGTLSGHAWAFPLAT
jgi:hypothetical protein